MGAHLDGWTWVDNPRSGGSTYDPDGEGYPWRICLHTIEGRGFPNLATHPYPPHLWYDPVTRARYQTVPLDRGAFALYQAADAPYYTNRARCLQVEMVGYAAEAADWPDSSLRNIAADVIVPLVQWARAQGGDVDLSDPAVPLPGAIPNSAREDAPQRLAPKVWAFGPVGLVGHRHVPMGDDHWDAGGLNARLIAAYARATLEGDDFLSALSTEQQQILFNNADYAAKMLKWIEPGQAADIRKLFNGTQAAIANHDLLVAVTEALKALPGSVAAAVVAKLPTGGTAGGSGPSLEDIRKVVHDELEAEIRALVLRPEAAT